MRIIPLKIKNEETTRNLMASLGASKDGIRILAPKSIAAAFKIQGIKSWEANIIKQHLLSLGSDAAIARSALLKNIKTDIVIFGNLSQLKKLALKLKGQPFSLNQLSQELLACLKNIQKREFILRAGGKELKIKGPLVCGIINLSPDSFSGDGLTGRRLALERAEQMLKAGAGMIDVGGESSRPFSRPVREAEEIKRVVPVLRAIRKRFPKAVISIDTYKGKVARAAASEGVDIINDITALRHCPRTADLIKKHKLGCILMHMKGKPRSMQVNPRYKDVIDELMAFFAERLDFCSGKGIDSSQIAIDPGIGFGKAPQDNIRIIKDLYGFKAFGRPLFLGLSRKSFIGKILKAEAQKRLWGSLGAACAAYFKGADILRVHDVAETAAALKIAEKLNTHY